MEQSILQTISFFSESKNDFQSENSNVIPKFFFFFLHLAYTTVTFGPLYLFSVITRTTVTTVTSQIVSAVLNHLRESLLMKPSAQSSDPLWQITTLLSFKHKT